MTRARKTAPLDSVAKAVRKHRFLGVALALALCGACSSPEAPLQGEGPVPEGTEDANGVGPLGDGGNGGTAAPSQVTDDTGVVVNCADLQRPPTPLRRLTRFEYNNTVRDLFATSLTPADEFPPDEVADGFSNNALVLTVSSLHAERYTIAAEAVAADATSRLATLLPCEPAVTGEQECARQFAELYGRRAYRRALDAQDIDVLMAAYAVGNSFDKGIEIMIRTMLQSPHFLFRVEYTGADTAGASMLRLDPYETAVRLSYLVWSSMPDDILLDEAANGRLSTPEQVAEQTRRMLADPKAKPAVTEFYRQWLELTRLNIITKDVEAFPLWSEAMRSAMIDEANAVVEAIVFGETPTLTQLLTSPLGLPKGPLAQLYGASESAEVTTLAADQRRGFLTLPGFLSVQAHPDQTSPVLRGLFVREKLLCTHVPPPPDDVSISLPDPAEGGTARERFSAHATASCAACHDLMDPLGYPFENYDATGAYRTTDQGRELDLSGELIGTKQLNGPFNGVHEMADILASGQEVRDCVAAQWYKYAMGRGTEAGDACSLSPLQTAFSQSGANLKELIVATTQTESFLYRRASQEASQ